MTKDQVIDLIGYILMVPEFIEDSESIEELSKDRLIRLALKWRNDFGNLVKREHSGDCRKQPWSCIRCYQEKLKEDATRILEAYLE